MAVWGQALQELTCISFLVALGRKVDQHPHFADGKTEGSEVRNGVGEQGTYKVTPPASSKVQI